ncbi:copper-translocating P-type ATPase [Halobiforma lacisalsi AJ5]|uniref:Copper-translocating P-type ATPase n=1 Tax=Natronobacterium lacisalsi AJ5 TaxID=358396 RepID=M0LGX9_NATLA|nr:cation-translocating P-type ATPase [Halobiforma lacisalsi]APW99553.1 copper-translocating P-type ATPase [Halobiforma lacisalsi AJ5]EMA31679.1 heavy metal translocating P-type ATPase [Halobiforma lacisalsi AJ5]
MTACTLCGLPVGDRPVREDDLEGAFCCRGCLEVHRIRDGADDGPSPDEVDREGSLLPADTSDADGPGTGDGDETLETAFLALEGMHCTTCERFLETVAVGTAGIREARASYATEMIRLRYDPETIDREELPAALEGVGYRAHDPGDDREREGSGFDFGEYRTAFAVLLAMPVMAPYLLFIYPTYLGLYPPSFLHGSTIRTMVFVPLALWSTLVLLGLGYPIFRSGYVSLAVRRPNVDVLVSIAVLAAYAYSLAAFAVGSRHVYFDVAVMVLVVVTVGNRLETAVKRRAADAHSDLAAARETTARRVAGDGSLEEVPREACDPGDRVVVNSGDRLPFDGTVVDGTATVDESFVTGESIPRSVASGDAVVGGAVLTDGTLTVAVDDSSTLDRLVELLWEVQSTEVGPQRLVNGFALAFVPLVIVLAGVAAALWLAAGASAETALLIGLSVLVVSCPCSLGIATPLALAAGSGRAAEAGAAVLSANALERITDSEIVVFDKTGTLTTGEMTVERVAADDPEAVLERAAAVESRSSHPIAEAIVEVAPATDRAVDGFERDPRSVSATVDGRRVTVGHPAAFRSDGAWTLPDRFREAIESAREDGCRPTVVGWDGVVRGVVAVRDRPRENWADVVAALAADGRRIVVLTGDDERATGWLRNHPDVDDVFAGVRPASKEAVVRGLREDGTTTMIGDGTNDAPALARADMGIALEEGTDVAMDAADVVVRGDDLEAIPTVFAVSRSTRRRIRTNLGWAVCYNLLAIPLAMAGAINPLVAALLMGASSLVVVANSFRSAGGFGPGWLRRSEPESATESGPEPGISAR